MQVEQHIDRIDQWAYFPRAIQLNRMARAVQYRLIPDAVQIFVDEAGGSWVAWIKALEGRQIDEGDRQPPNRRDEIGP